MTPKKLFPTVSKTPNLLKRGDAFKTLQKIILSLPRTRDLKVLFHLLFLLICTSCYDEFSNTWNGYRIDKGSHYSKGRVLSSVHGNRLLFDAVFTKECLHDSLITDLNKLYGFVDANSSVHRNSARFAWVSTGNKIDIYVYLYRDGVRTFKKIGETLPNERHSYEIRAKGNSYLFKFDTVEMRFNRFHYTDKGARLRLYPYFGGNLPAPNDMLILIFEKD